MQSNTFNIILHPLDGGVFYVYNYSVEFEEKLILINIFYTYKVY